MPVLSVIIPIGNLSRDLANVKEICSESMGDFFEFILIVDQPLAPTKAELSELENSHTRIIHKFNQSPGLSRNFGTSLAQGEYICFWDSDDEPNKQVIHKALERKDLDFDVAIFNYTVTNLDLNTRIVIEHQSNVERCFRTPAVWRMVFRNKESIVGRFGINMCGEDQVFLLTSGILTKKVLFFQEIAYNYLIHSVGQLSRNTLSPAGILNSYFECIDLLRNMRLTNQMNWNLALNLFNSVIKRFMLYPRREKFKFVASFPSILNSGFLKSGTNRILQSLNDFRCQDYLGLAGGLGNQMFQYSAGYSLSTERINLVTNLFYISRNKEGLPELSDCKLLGDIKYYSNFHFSRIFRKTVNSCLRLASSTNSELLIKSYSVFASIVASFLFFVENQSLMHVRISANTGRAGSRNRFIRTLHIGYFQSNLNTEKIVSHLKYSALVDIDANTTLTSLIKKSIVVQPVMVHVRLGDYENENDIGLLSKEYFTSALRLLARERKFDQVWIFSNNPVKAREYFADFKGVDFWAVEDRGFRSADTLELMRHMNGFVIANSTFSWWGARLGYLNDLQIVSPNPWFKNLKNPSQLLPLKWLEAEAIFYEN